MTTDIAVFSLDGTFTSHRAQLRSAAQKIVGTRELAEDITQEAYLKLIENTGLAIKQPLAYCFQVVRNLAIDYHRRMKLESHVFAEEEDGQYVPAPQGTPEQITIGRQNLAQVNEVLDRLPARTRQAFELYRLNGLTQRDIGTRLGVSATLVNFMIRDATQALMQCRHLLARD